jgi:hypothetical protein
MFSKKAIPSITNIVVEKTERFEQPNFMDSKTDKKVRRLEKQKTRIEQKIDEF